MVITHIVVTVLMTDLFVYKILKLKHVIQTLQSSIFSAAQKPTNATKRTIEKFMLLVYWK